jgi:hypothetical protein
MDRLVLKAKTLSDVEVFFGIDEVSTVFPSDGVFYMGRIPYSLDSVDVVSLPITITAAKWLDQIKIISVSGTNIPLRLIEGLESDLTNDFFGESPDEWPNGRLAHYGCVVTSSDTDVGDMEDYLEITDGPHWFSENPYDEVDNETLNKALQRQDVV